MDFQNNKNGKKGKKKNNGKKRGQPRQTTKNLLEGVTVAQAEGIMKKLEQQRAAEYAKFMKQYKADLVKAWDAKITQYIAKGQGYGAIGNLHKAIFYADKFDRMVTNVQSGFIVENGMVKTIITASVAVKLDGVRSDIYGQKIRINPPPTANDFPCTGRELVFGRNGVVNKIAAIKSDPKNSGIDYTLDVDQLIREMQALRATTPSRASSVSSLNNNS